MTTKGSSSVIDPHGMEIDLPYDILEGKSIVTHLDIWTDGGSRGNPGPSAYGAVLKAQDGRTWRVSHHIGNATNNDAEYRGLIAALKRAKDLGAISVKVRMDSLLIVNQLKGLYATRNFRMKEYVRAARGLLDEFKMGAVVEHVPRHLNTEADALVNETLDNGK